ncbi:hypothetical protein [Paenibacillus pabuli]|uniref:hypothetical protein n=1 Tax=Paenibacillus pabuli TaxID=1472 RepID=UPI001FFED1AB|nr:hypothetical protein [Paenibacillus pabuli]UPK47679.1 hypothetical protein KET34_24355 [Paenibacillus pabuli]
MLVNVNHDGIGLTEIVFSPKVTVRDTAFDDWLLLTHFYHLDIYCLRTAKQLFPNEMPDHDMVFYSPFPGEENAKKPPQGRFCPIHI